MDVQAALALLGVAPGARPHEIRRAYLDLVKVWDPDRFSDDPRLHAKASTERERVIEAYVVARAGAVDFAVGQTQPRPHSGSVQARPPLPSEGRGNSQ